MSYRSEPVTMWFDRRLVLGMSPIHGTGTFAREDIRAGETLIWVTGGLVHSPQGEQTGSIHLAGALYNEADLADNLVILTPKVFHYYINHSCEPNAIDQSQHPTWTHYIALRDIRANEEVTADYYDTTTLAACACNAPSCRWTQGDGNDSSAS